MTDCVDPETWHRTVTVKGITSPWGVVLGTLLGGDEERSPLRPGEWAELNRWDQAQAVVPSRVYRGGLSRGRRGEKAGERGLRGMESLERPAKQSGLEGTMTFEVL